MSPKVTTVLTLLLAPPLAGQPPAAPAKPAAAPPADATLFRDVTASAGVDFVHVSAPEKKYIVESMGGGVALLDIDNDGFLDVYFVNSLTVDTATRPETAPSALYRNRGAAGGIVFEEVSKAAGVAYPGWGMGACVADVDADGWQDLYVTGIGRNVLYRNRGDGTFEDVSEKLGVAGGGWSTGCGFADVDRDGRLDLFVSRYVKFDLDNLPAFGKGKTCRFRGIAVQCGPRGLPGTPDLFFRQRADGTFEEVAKAAGVQDPDGYFGLGVAWFDHDGDGWLDLFVANDANPNFLYRNLGNGKFEETAFPMGVAVSEDGSEQGSMGVALGDYLNQGRLSLYVTNFAEEYNALYHSQPGYFEDRSFRSASAPPSLPYVGWGTAFLDYDNDGLLDLITVNGHVYPQLQNAQLGASAGYRQRKLLYRGTGGGRFEEIAARFGPALMEERVSRGLALGDLDNDGRLDVVVNDLDGAAQVLRNELPDAGNWLRLKLEGSGGHRSAVGATVTVRWGDNVQTQIVRSGTSYLSQDDLRLHFGVGAATKVDSIEVAWPDGSREQVEGGPVNRDLLIRQGK